jgi:hypothetical protein
MVTRNKQFVNSLSHSKKKKKKTFWERLKNIHQHLSVSLWREKNINDDDWFVYSHGRATTGYGRGVLYNI